MRRMQRARVTAAGTAVVVAALLAGCGPAAGEAKAPAAVPGSPSSEPPQPLPLTPAHTPPESMSPPAGAGPSATVTPAPVTKPSAPASALTAAPARRTVLSMFASTAGGRIELVRGGAAKEFTVSVHNGNARAYAELAVAFQMEIMESTGDGPAPARNGLVLERRDPATGRWNSVELRVANDVQPHWLVPSGSPLARDASRVERFRLRAAVKGPIGRTPLMIKIVDTAAPAEAAYDTAVPARTSLTVSVGM
ncbi:hypothetical protein OHA27_18705 [Streptomyces sp. NBC_01619]|uniref:hypothetical protein n=1 Tax=Streptomyces sp. NBC_01619 TaxID=2975901 RepID=UPI002256F03B|nr:hypothetical protein [Streptomyces sp. NBC_01619]MCX4512295.1 hypothetical protein [Streptomyces sp. NBC_01619]